MSISSITIETPPALAERRETLIGQGRAGLAEALGEIGVPERERACASASSGTGSIIAASPTSTRMTNVAKELRAELAEHFTLERPEIVTEQVSTDGTRKWLMRLPSTRPATRGAEIETVYIPESDRGTLCVSSQVGCTLNCTLLPHRHAEAGAQPHAAEIVGAGHDRARPAWRMARRSAPKHRSACRTRRARHQHRVHGHGRAALQFRQCARRDRG